MKRLVLALLTTVLLGLPASRALAAEGPVDCQEPIAVENYDGEHMSYGLAVDYSTCSWWDGSPIRLEPSSPASTPKTLADVVNL